MEEAYIKRVIGGDAEAFRFLIRKYQHMAFTVAMSVVKDEYTAEEITQEAFIKAFENLSKFRFQSKFSTWLYRIVVNLAFRQLKKLKRQEESYFSTTNDNFSDEPDGFDSLNKTDRTYYINRVLNILSPKESLALRLFYLDENSVEKVNEITGWSASNTKVILHRARKNFYSALSELLQKEVKTIL